MKLNDFFIGRPVYWILAGAVAAIMAVLGSYKLHVRDFVPFQFAVLILAAIVVAVLITVYRPGERATRETIDIEDGE